MMKGQSAAFVADLIPTMAHLPDPWIMGFDLYPMDTLAAKKQFAYLATIEPHVAYTPRKEFLVKYWDKAYVGPIKPVLSGLPRVLRVNLRADESGAWFENTLSHAVEQAAAARPGSAVFLAHLAEALFADVLRRYLSSLPRGRTGWLSGAGDPAVGRALAALHRRPAHDWSLEALSREAGVSRSALSRRRADGISRGLAHRTRCRSAAFRQPQRAERGARRGL